MERKCNIGNRKVGTLAVLVLLGLSACRNDSLPAAEEAFTGEPIAFVAQSDGEAAAGRAAFGEAGYAMGVYADYYANAGDAAPTGMLMENQDVAYDGKIWDYSPKRYWPVSGTLAFYAYAPHTTEVDADGVASYTLDGTQDVLWAEKVNDSENRSLSYADDKNGVKFSFVHKLMHLKFKFIKGTGFGEGYRVTNIHVTNVAEGVKLDVRTGDITLTDTGRSGDFIFGNANDTYPLVDENTGTVAAPEMFIAADKDATEDVQTIRVSADILGVTYATDVRLTAPAGRKSYLVKLTFTNVSLSSDVTVVPWAAGGTTDGGTIQ